MTMKARIVNQGLGLKEIREILKDRYRIFAAIPEISYAINKKRLTPKSQEICRAIDDILCGMEKGSSTIS